MFTVFIISILLTVFNSCYCGITYNLTIHGETQHGYFITVLLGTPPQEINLLLDTGSSNIAVACIPTSHNTKYFHSNDSSTLLPYNIAVDLHYVVGRWNGFLAKEYIHFSNQQLECSIACMTVIDGIFDEMSQFQGLLGLAYPIIALPDSSVHPFMDILTSTENISDIFSLDLCGPYFTSNEQWTNCGKFQIGYLPDRYKPEDIIYTPVHKEWFYEVVLTDFRVGMNHMPVHCSELNKGKSIIDTGTTGLCLPHAVYNWTIDQIKNDSNIPRKYWTDDVTACIPNSKFHIETFPPVTLSFYHTENSTFNLVISPELYLLSIQTFLVNTTCFKLAFVPGEEGVFVGSSVLRGFYVVFDRQNRRIGFANSSYLNIKNNLPGFVMEPKFTNNKVETCFKKEKAHASSHISPLMIILLFCAVLVTIILLYMLVSWIFRYFRMRNDDLSDTNSLVYDDEFL